MANGSTGRLLYINHRCIANIIILVVGAASYGGYKRSIAHLSQVSADHVSKWSRAFHILINILSTILLCASNYTMQVLNSATREDVDRAHSQGKYLDIGIFSTCNLQQITKKRLILWWMLGILLVPLHILYANSSKFQFDLTLIVTTLRY
jgi:hypothetical protein